MKKLITLVCFVLAVVLMQAQTFHNYFSQTSGLYVQIGIVKGAMMFRYPSGTNPFITLKYMGSQNGMNYYGAQNFQVAIQGNAARLCVMGGRNSEWFNYCGPVPVPSPTPNMGYGMQSPQQSTSSKCPWCNGKGRIYRNDHVPQYGTNSVDVIKRCGECGFEFNANYTNHYHLDCGHCGGTGKLRR